MGIRYYKPTSPGRRNASVSDFSELTDKNKKPEKSLTEPIQKKGGRNNQGFITRAASRRRPQADVPPDRLRRNDRTACPPRSRTSNTTPTARARIALIVYPDGEKRYMLAPEGLKAGMTVIERSDRRAEGRQLPADGQDSHRHHDPQHRDAARSRRQALPVGRRRCHADGSRRELGPDHAAHGRSPPRRRPPAGRPSARLATPIT